MPAVLIGVAIVVLGYVLLEHRGASSPRAAAGEAPTGESIAAGIAPTALTTTSADATGGQASVAPPSPPPSSVPTPTGARSQPSPSIAAPSPGNPTAIPPPPSPISAPADTLAWIFGNGGDALRAGYGNVFRAANGTLSVTTPKGALGNVSLDTIYGNAQAALKAGYGRVYQQGGSYFVTGPAGATKLSSSFQPHVASQDLSNYGAVAGVIRGWTIQADRLGNLQNVPAHSVPGSTYQGEASGPPPSQADWAALTSAKGSLPAGVHA